MKKWFNIAILVTLVGFVACTKVDSVDAPKKISFAVASYVHATKAGELNLKDDEGITAFRSKAWIHAAGANEAEEFMDETISWDGAAWSPSRDIYWPKHPQSYINFVSWYAHDGSANITPDVVSETNFDINTRTIGANDRILVADEAWRQRANTTTYFTPGVPTLFRHVLSRVKVNMKATTLTDPEISGVTYEITLESASFQGVYQRGNMKLLNSALTETGTRTWYSSESPTYLWKTAAGSNASDIEFEGADITLGTDYTTILAERSIIPQVVGNTIKMVLLYSVTTKSNGVITATENDIPATIIMNNIKNASDVAIDKWLPNKIYTYNIAINPVGKEILLNPTVEAEWSFAEDINVTVE